MPRRRKSHHPSREAAPLATSSLALPRFSVSGEEDWLKWASGTAVDPLRSVKEVVGVHYIGRDIPYGLLYMLLAIYSNSYSPMTKMSVKLICFLGLKNINDHGLNTVTFLDLSIRIVA